MIDNSFVILHTFKNGSILCRPLETVEMSLIRVFQTFSLEAIEEQVKDVKQPAEKGWGQNQKHYVLKGKYSS